MSKERESDARLTGRVIMLVAELPEDSLGGGLAEFTDDSLEMPAPVSVADDTNEMLHDSSMPAIGKTDQFGIHVSGWFGDSSG